MSAHGSTVPKTAEPVAVIGTACRLPGQVASPDDFWELLRDGRDAVSEVPAERWRDYEGRGARADAVLRRTTRWGGFLDDVAGFDADFFGISPREARAMDPQQRLLLEVAWEALERAGTAPGALAGTHTGVFVGVWSDDYGRRLLEDMPGIEAWTGVGTTLGSAAARLSYHLGLTGPSLAVDTACSSSLVAVHQACESLRRKETSLALAAGVNLLLSPGLTVNFDQAGALSRSGRCRTFDAGADGYVRAEGCGVVVLKLLSDAIADGDPVLGVLRGSAVTQNGHGAGIMAPSGEAQARTIRLACEYAGVGPDTLDYVEAHGTGTPAGDPAEAAGIGAAVGADRADDDPCLIGSVKTNLGHAESAAGVIGLIKVLLALRHDTIPPNLHYRTANPAIPMAELGLRVVTEPTPWPRREGPRRAGVSSYGFGGTNAHLIVEEAPPAAPAPATPGAPERTPRVVPWSGSTEAARGRYAARLADWLAGPGSGTGVDAVAGALAGRRTHSGYRAAAVADDPRELVATLRAQAADEAAPDLVTGRVLPAAADGTVWVFSGHGSQWTGMARELLATEPVFAGVIDELEPVFQEEAGFSLRGFLAEQDAEAAGADQVQPVIFAVQTALAELWLAHGVRPAAVIGHSVGEIAAAVACAGLSRTDGARLVCRRSALLRRAAGQGAMALVGLPADEVRKGLARARDTGISVAISASPESTVVAGAPEDIDRAVARWTREGALVRRVASDVAFHSPHMDPLLEDLAAAVRDLPHHPQRIPMYSTSGPAPRGSHVLDAGYWVGNLRGEVRLEAAVRAAAEDGYRVFVEISAHPVVVHSVRETLQHAGVEDACVTGTLRRTVPDRRAFLRSLAQLHCHGVPVDPRNPAAPLPAGLPTTAWDHQPHWIDTPPTGAAGWSPGAGTLLGAPALLDDTLPVRVWRSRVAADAVPGGPVATPGGPAAAPSVLLATLLAAATVGDPAAAVRLCEVRLPEPLLLDGEQDVQTVAGEGTVGVMTVGPAEPAPGSPDGTGPHPAALHRPHATARLGTPAAAPDADGTRPAGTDPLPPPDEGHQDAGTAFAHRILGLRATATEVSAEIALDTDPRTPVDGWAPWLDAAVRLAGGLLPDGGSGLTPGQADEIMATGPVPERARVTVVRTGGHTEEPLGAAALAARADLPRVTVTVTGPDGSRLQVAGLGFRPAAGGEPAAQAADTVLAVEWEPLPLGADAPPGDGRVLVVGAPDGPAEALAEGLRAAGAHTLRAAGTGRLADWRTRLTAADAVLLVPPADGTEPDPRTTERVAAVCEDVVRAVRTLASWPEGQAPRLWCATGAWGDPGTEPLEHFALRGLSRVASGEHPELWGGLVHRDAGLEDHAACRDLYRVIRGGQGEDVLRLGPQGPLRPRLAPAARSALTRIRCVPDGTYLITGGLGALGLRFAEQLVAQGARRLVLLGRQSLPPRAEWDSAADPVQRYRIERVRRLEQAGATVRTLSLDIADEEGARALLDPDALGMPPVRGVLHAAGVIHGGMLRDLEPRALRAVLQPKVAGAMTLHRLFPPGSLDFLVLFSAVAAQLGLAGQGGYAAANAFLDALAERRRSAGCPALSIAWPAWRDTGLAATAGALESEFAAVGVTDLTEAQAMAAWRYARGREPAHLVVLPVDRGRRPLRELPLLQRLFDAPGPEAESGPESAYRGLRGTELRTRVQEAVNTLVAAELGRSATTLDEQRALADLGMESIMALAVRRSLEKEFGLSLPATLLWNYPTARALGGRIADLLSPRDEPGGPDTAAPPDPAGDPGTGFTDGFDALLDEFETDPATPGGAHESAHSTGGQA